MARKGVALALVAVLVVAGMAGVLVGGQFLGSDQPPVGAGGTGSRVSATGAERNG